MKLDEWLKAARVHAKLSQEALGEALGRTKANISSWEKGRHTPSIEQLLKISQITNYALPPEITGYSNVEEVPLTNPREKVLLDLFAALPKSEQEELIRILEEKKKKYDKLFEELLVARKIGRGDR